MDDYFYGDHDDLWIDLTVLLESVDEDPDCSQDPGCRYFEYDSVHTSGLDAHKQKSFPASTDAMSNQMAEENNVSYEANTLSKFNTTESKEMHESYSCGLAELPFLSRNVVGSDPSNSCHTYDRFYGYERKYTYSQSSLSSNNVVGASNSSIITNNSSEFIPPDDDVIFHIDEDGNFSSINSFTPKSSTSIDEEIQEGPVTSCKLILRPTDANGETVLTPASSNTVESIEKECYSLCEGTQCPVSTNISTGVEDIKDGESLIQAKAPRVVMQLVGVKDEMLGTQLLEPNTVSHVLDANSGLSTEILDHGSPSFDESHDICIVKDSDVCVLEDISQPARINPCGELVTQSASLGAVGSMRLKTIDERLILRVAMQDLSQPKSETSPPDGSLAVPLLRHQRIALSWMVQKETSGWYCSGGILADDQGLGKTVSTIALILKERRPAMVCGKTMRPGESQTLNLEEDDDAVTKHVGLCDSKVLSKGRPSAGTLIVCPTSVLRQWDEELHNKVTDKANLSVLVYHGSNRTRDPHELAKYDVVLTTYSIVSMEVPKKQTVGDDDADREKLPASLAPDFYSSQKRKHSFSNTKRCFKGQKRLDGSFVELDLRPLAKVGWFRVVLDEAQSIKNHRTQVARACCGLRAKRRWCLSGTPIQNTIDDLYSYFRFLRYDPFVTYNAFYSAIKAPISRCPVNGYKKLQAVLKTIMLRRTKGTLLDGKPIIALPPKSIELKKVDFSKEERDFYTRLEDDSRAQFEVYAAAGTLKQNYVNILLMLLRLRQACDHPLLIKKSSCNSVWESSLEAARNLPVERQASLLSFLEASLAICNICNDAPEDAVVAVCGHVFCNQCISEHLTGNNILCPSWNCKFRLNTASLFSRDTLNTSLHGVASSQLSEVIEPGSDKPSFTSSKIKAAMLALESVSNSCGREMNMAQESSCDTAWSESPPLGGKAIVFSQWTRMLDLLEECLINSSLQYRRLDGTMSVSARDRAVKDFNSLPQVSVMIMSLKAASLGLNMVAACHVLMLDLWWNPATEDQAIDRAHRIGQTRPVKVLRLTVKDTVEDRILALQQKKREMVASAFGEDETGAPQACLTVDDLKFLFTA